MERRSAASPLWEARWHSAKYRALRAIPLRLREINHRRPRSAALRLRCETFEAHRHSLELGFATRFRDARPYHAVFRHLAWLNFGSANRLVETGFRRLGSAAPTDDSVHVQVPTRRFDVRQTSRLLRQQDWLDRGERAQRRAARAFIERVL